MKPKKVDVAKNNLAIWAIITLTVTFPSTSKKRKY